MSEHERLCIAYHLENGRRCTEQTPKLDVKGNTSTEVLSHEPSLFKNDQEMIYPQCFEDPSRTDQLPSKEDFYVQVSPDMPRQTERWHQLSEFPANVSIKHEPSNIKWEYCVFQTSVTSPSHDPQIPALPLDLLKTEDQYRIKRIKLEPNSTGGENDDPCSSNTEKDNRTGLYSPVKPPPAPGIGVLEPSIPSTLNGHHSITSEYMTIEEDCSHGAGVLSTSEEAVGIPNVPPEDKERSPCNATDPDRDGVADVNRDAYPNRDDTSEVHDDIVDDHGDPEFDGDPGPDGDGESEDAHPLAGTDSPQQERKDVSAGEISTSQQLPDDVSVTRKTVDDKSPEQKDEDVIEVVSLLEYNNLKKKYQDLERKIALRDYLILDELPVSENRSGDKGDENELSVDRGHKENAGNKKRNYDKLLACVYCGKLLKHRISEHLQCQHEDEPEVAAAYAAKGEKRKGLLALLKNKGNFKHNMRVLAAKQSDIIVAKRPQNGITNAADYLPCIYCYGFYRKDELWRHVKGCQFRHPKATVEITKVSKLLLATENGLIAKHKGKSLEDINVEEDEPGPRVLSKKANRKSFDDESKPRKLHRKAPRTSCLTDENMDIDDSDVDQPYNPATSNSSMFSEDDAPPDPPNPPKKDKYRKKRWSDAENKIFKKYLFKYIKQKIIPPVIILEKVVKDIPGRTIAQIRTRAHNVIQGKQVLRGYQ